MKRRVVSLLLALFMALAIAPTAFAQAAEEYELRVLTFEDGSEGELFDNIAGVQNWSGLIDSPQYDGPLLYPEGADTAYWWRDGGNTLLYHEFTNGWGDYKYWGGGHAISNYVSGDIEENGGYTSQLTVYKAGVTGVARTGGGHNGSDNFVVHYGYTDNSGYSDYGSQFLYFEDGIARVIDHMYVNSTTYLLNCIMNGNDLTAKIGEDDWIAVVATGYDQDGEVSGTTSIYLCNGPDNILMDWTKWDLSSLGPVIFVNFNVTGSSDNGYGFSQPAYFAYDDVAVRFPKSEQPHEHIFGDDGYCECGEYNEEAVVPHEHSFGENGYCECGEYDPQKLPRLKADVNAEKQDTWQVGMAYLLSELQSGSVFEGANGERISTTQLYCKQSNDGGETWSELLPFAEALFGATTIQVTSLEAGTVIYKFYASTDGTNFSLDAWTLTLEWVESYAFPFTAYVGKSYDSNCAVTEFNLYPADGNGNKLANSTAITVSGGEVNDKGYTVFTFEAPAGFYVYETQDANGNKLGGMQIKLPTDSNVDGGTGGGLDLYFQTVSFYTTSKMLDNSYFGIADYTVRVDCPIMECRANMGDAYVKGNYAYYPVVLYAGGNSCLYNWYLYPTDSDIYAFNQLINATFQPSASATTKYGTIGQSIQLTVKAPLDAQFDLYFQWNNFNTEKVQPNQDWVEMGGYKQAVYAVSRNNGNYTWRLTPDDDTKATQGGWCAQLSESGEFDLTGATFKSNPYSHSFTQLGTTTIERDEGDLMVNLDPSGYKAQLNDKRVRAYRHWELINSDTANIMMEPDFEWQVISGDATIKTVNGGNAKENWADITSGNEDSIITVHYNAFEAEPKEYGSHGGFYPATNPERTGVMVVGGKNVAHGALDADVDFNMAPGAETTRSMDWDYNYDTWFYNSDNQAPTLTFKVKGNGGVKSVQAIYVAHSADFVAEKSDAFTLTANDGSYTADLNWFNQHGNGMGGTVIIKMTDSSDKVSYRLVRVAKVTVTHSNLSSPGEPYMPGDKVLVGFDGLYRAVNKISGIFNPTKFFVRYTANGQEVNGTLGQYKQMDRASITLTIPEDAQGESYTFTNGYTYGSMYSAANSFTFLYGMTDTGVGTNFNAVTVEFYISRYDDITVPMVPRVLYDVTFSGVPDGAQFTLKDSDGNAIEPEDGGSYSLKYGEYTYHAECNGYIVKNGSFNLGSGTAHEDYKIIVPVDMVAAGEGAWDGTTTIQPQIADGVYQISTGAELAWFASKVNDGTGKNYNAVLTDDIELAGYMWTPIGNSSKKYAGTFDGCGHSVTNLCVERSTTNTAPMYAGLFGYVEGASTSNLAQVKNLVVSGTINATSTKSVSNAHIGGIVGYAKNATLSGLVNNVDVTIIRSSLGGNWRNVGGVAGYVAASNVENCYNTGNIKGYQYAGGIVGSINSSSTVKSCYNIGAISASSHFGGVIGYVNGNNVHQNIYYLEGTANIAEQAGEQMSAQQLKDPAMLTLLGQAFVMDSANINGGYPILTFQSTLPQATLGDVDGDGEINMTDAMLAAAYVNEKEELTPAQLAAADVNNDGVVDMVDAMMIAAYFNEAIEQF